MWWPFSCGSPSMRRSRLPRRRRRGPMTLCCRASTRSALSRMARRKGPFGRELASYNEVAPPQAPIDSKHKRGLHDMAKGAGKARKKLPKALAVVNADNCTGCEACIEVCPVDCIYKVGGMELTTLQSFVDI